MRADFKPIDQIVTELEDSLLLTEELAASGPAGSFGSKISSVPSNRVGQQFWCIAGSRESYAAAILHGKWMGFQPRLAYDDTNSKSSVLDGLSAGREAILKSASSLSTESQWTPERLKFLIDCLMHEAQHQGQLIRYWYALTLPFPSRFASRWALDEPDHES